MTLVAVISAGRQQAKTGCLVDPNAIAAEVVRLIEDDNSAGLIVAIRPDRAPYLLDPTSIDPYWQ